MKLETITHAGRRVSYKALVEVQPDPAWREAHVRDESGLWLAIVRIDDRLKTRLEAGDIPAYFWARIRGGDIELQEREYDPNWEEPK